MLGERFSCGGRFPFGGHEQLSLSDGSRARGGRRPSWPPSSGCRAVSAWPLSARRAFQPVAPEELAVFPALEKNLNVWIRCTFHHSTLKTPFDTVI